MIIIEQDNNLIVAKDESNMINYTTENIKNLIYTIRGKQVMLDSDVAMLYHYETKYINLAVKRNENRFPESFCFQLTEEEIQSLRLQIATLNKNGRGQHRKYMPYVFTEQGIAMLSGLLINQDRKLSNHEKNFEKIFNELQKDKEEDFKQKIFFNGQIYDAYSVIIDIIRTAQNKILIIDNYIDDSILKMLAKKNGGVEVIILTSSNSNIRKIDIQKFNSQYPSLKLSYTNKFHDRFIVIDRKDLYHIGASLKDLGKKCFAISKIEDSDYVEKISNFC